MVTPNLPYRQIRRNDEPVMWRPVIEPHFIYIDGKPFYVQPGQDVELINPRTGQHYRNTPGDFVQNWVLSDEDKEVFESYYPGVLEQYGQ